MRWNALYKELFYKNMHITLWFTRKHTKNEIKGPVSKHLRFFQSWKLNSLPWKITKVQQSKQDASNFPKLTFFLSQVLVQNPRHRKCLGSHLIRRLKMNQMTKFAKISGLDTSVLIQQSLKKNPNKEAKKY